MGPLSSLINVWGLPAISHRLFISTTMRLCIWDVCLGLGLTHTLLQLGLKPAVRPMASSLHCRWDGGRGLACLPHATWCGGIKQGGPSTFSPPPAFKLDLSHQHNTSFAAMLRPQSSSGCLGARMHVCHQAFCWEEEKMAFQTLDNSFCKACQS